MLLELSPLGSLRKLLNTQPDNVMTSQLAQPSLLHCIAGGMAYLHSLGMLHHDLKSANVRSLAPPAPRLSLLGSRA